MSLGFAAGLVADLGSAHPAGVLALCWLGVGLVCGTVADRRSVWRDALSAGLVCGAAAVAATLLLALVHSGPTVSDAVRYALPAGLGDVLLALGSSRSPARCCTPSRCARRTRSTRNWRSGRGVARPRTPPTPKRLGIVVVLVVSMMLTLFARLYYVQLLDPNKPVQTAHLRHEAAIVIPAPRGLIVDALGRPLVANTTEQVITVNRDVLLGRADHGQPMLRRLAALLHTSATRLGKEITPCSTTVPAPCSTGEPYAPVTVATNAPVERRPVDQGAPRTVPGRRGRDGQRAALRARPAGGPPARLPVRGHRGGREARPATQRLRHHRGERARGGVRQVPARDRRQAVRPAQPAGLHGRHRRHGRRAAGRHARRRASTRASSSSPRTRWRSRSPTPARPASRPPAARSSSWIRRPGASSRRPATRRTTRRCSSAASPPPTTRG